jgi:hypothetical protein
MALYPPTPSLSTHDKRLIELMARLLLEQLNNQFSDSNRTADEVVLTDEEANELMGLVNQLVESKEFAETAFFVEGLTDANTSNDRQLREIYLSARGRNGRSRALASYHWAEFRVRLGIVESPVWNVAAAPMSLDHFHQMERKLLMAAGVTPRVADFVMKIVTAQDTGLQQLREKKRSLPRGIVKRAIWDPFSRLVGKGAHRSCDRLVSATRVAAALTLMSNISIMFTTRDWGVAGTLSTMAGALAATVTPE